MHNQDEHTIGDSPCPSIVSTSTQSSNLSSLTSLSLGNSCINSITNESTSESDIDFGNENENEQIGKKNTVTCPLCKHEITRNKTAIDKHRRNKCQTSSIFDQFDRFPTMDTNKKITTPGTAMTNETNKKCMLFFFGNCASIVLCFFFLW